AIILDRELEPLLADRLGADADLGRAPLAGVLHAIAGDLQQVLPLPQKVEIVWRVPVDGDPLLAEDPLQRAGELVGPLGDRGALPLTLGAGRGAGAAEVMVDLLAHGLGLAAYHVGKRPGPLPGLGEHHRDRRLERVRQVADMRALALHDLLIVGYERVQ